MKEMTSEIESELSEQLRLAQKLSKPTLFVARVKNFPYQFWLTLLRDVEIMITLCDNYEKIPARTPSKLIVGFFVKSLSMKKLLYKLEKSLRRRIY